jgi:hypothetical protein
MSFGYFPEKSAKSGSGEVDLLCDKIDIRILVEMGFHIFINGIHAMLLLLKRLVLAGGFCIKEVDLVGRCQVVLICSAKQSIVRNDRVREVVLVFLLPTCLASPEKDNP